jgi:hypothetical protein
MKVGVVNRHAVARVNLADGEVTARMRVEKVLPFAGE